MNSKRKRNTILAYCMATVIMLCVLASNIFEATTSLKTTKKVVAGNNYVETSEISYGLVAIEASSSIDEKNAQNVTEEKEEKKEESQKESEKTSVNKNVSSTSNVTKAATSKKTTSNKSTTSKKTTTTKKSNATTTKKSNTTTTKKSNTTTTKKTTTVKSNTTTTKKTTTSNVSTTKKTNNSGLGTQIANYAKQFNGNPYVYGGTSLTKGADCSGFVQSVYKHFGISIPRTARAQAKVGRTVSWNDLQPGDLIFYGHNSTTIAHVALYIGNGKIIHAQTPKLGIGISTYKIMTRIVARRII